jgi:hypothetical protein
MVTISLKLNILSISSHKLDLPLFFFFFVFFCIFLFLLVISLVSISLLWGVMLGPDLWVVDVNVILAFGSRRTSVSLGFLALSVKK